jgi:hypothetical protein
MEFERSTRAGTPQPLVLVLSPGGERVSGSVVDASGGVIAGALVGAVSAQGERAVALADGLGNFTLDVTAGAQDLQVTAEGYSTIQRQIQAPVEGLKLALVAEASITGRVVAEGTLAPVGDVTVSAWSPDGPSTGARAERSAEDGTFRLKGLGPKRRELAQRRAVDLARGG